uniref:cation channel sperm-associated protein subunit beta-like isoform X5 n=1 Tax=Podarcis muralis TaxID=64176 RepID=UPI0010A0A410|nr:cation channel sperm-associated protein subunit beta-like isoform X5 [Podarcis muralis]
MEKHKISHSTAIAAAPTRFLNSPPMVGKQTGWTNRQEGKPSLPVFALCKSFKTNQITIRCHLYNINKPDTEENRRKNLVLFTSVGLAPSIQIFNSTYSKVFYFKMTLGEGVDSWSIEINREELTYNTDPLLQWYWTLGESLDINDTLSEVANIQIAKTPCASDVALLGLIYKTKNIGLILGLTDNGFTGEDTVWFNLSATICAILENDCYGLALVDLTVTNTRLVLLTSLGLFISDDLRIVTGKLLQFNKPTLCGFEMDDYLKAEIWYSRQCLANKELYETDYVGLSFNKDKSLSQESTCFYSNDTFQKWHSCLPHKMKGERHLSRRVVSFLVDYEQNTGIALLSQQNRALISVHKLTDGSMNKKRKFPAFWFPDPRFIPNGLYFHTNSHFLYAYGNQVWISYDGGINFAPLFTLNAEMVIDVDSCVYTQAIIFVTDAANLLYTKAGLLRYAKVFAPAKGIFNMYFDHLGILNHISLNHTIDSFVKETSVDVDTLLKDIDLGFEFPLAVQYITEEQMLLLNHEPLIATKRERFSNLQRGKRLDYGPGGSCIIREVFRTPAPPGFISSVLVDVLDRFPVESKLDSPCTANTLRVLPPTGTSISYRLQLTSPGVNIFKPTDLEKTVVIPGSSSFFIVQVVNDQNALGDATMPNRLLLNTDIPPGRWFLYDFGTVNKRKWKIVVDICRYTIQQFDDLPRHAIKYLDIGSKLELKFRVTPINVAYNVFHNRLIHIVIGRPSLLDVRTKTYYDDNNSNLIDITVHSRFFEKGKTTIAVIALGSLRCEVVTLVLTLKNSCSYLKSMHYVLSAKTSPSDWLVEDVSAEPNGSAIARLLKQLPVNYRPPSVLGIAVPLTENFYNADPSKPKLRDYFTNSKNSGRYKQCAGKSKRSECGCTENMKLSFSVAFSDCKEKALRMKFPVSRLPLYFTIEDEGRSVNLTSPYFITIIEVNNRTNWKVSGTNQTSSMLKMKTYLEHRLKTELYNPDGLSITITMALLQLYLVLAAVLQLSSGLSYNLNVVANSSFSCYTGDERNMSSKAIKLFLSDKSLIVRCYLYNINKPDTEENRRKNLVLFTSAGLAPSIQIFNSTYSKVFYFKMTLGEGVDSWSIEINREELTYNTDINPIEEWFVKFNMHHGLNMFTTTGTLLDVIRDPLLQWYWTLGESLNINDTLSEVANIQIAKTPCASDVALLGLIYKTKNIGLILGLTDNGFTGEDTVWFNLSATICAILENDCYGLALVDLTVTNTRLVLLTSLGLFISDDLRIVTGKLLQFNKPTLCGFEMDDYLKAEIWYSRQCLANKELYETDYVGLSFNKDKSLSQESTCFYSNDTFQKWHSCLPHKMKGERHLSRRVVSFLVDYEQNTGIALLSQQNRALISVHKLTDGSMNKKRKFPAFWFPDPRFIPKGLYFHTNSHFLYAYGNQVWISYDGGTNFAPLFALNAEMVIDVDSCVYTQAIIFVTDAANLLYTKAGVLRYAKVFPPAKGIFNMYFDHLGILNYISLNDTIDSFVKETSVDVDTLLKDIDLGFECPLAVQYITEEQMLLLNHEPLIATKRERFSNLQRGKRLDYEPGGSCIIREVFRTPAPPGFISSVLVDVLDRFPVESKLDSPCTANTLRVLPPTGSSISYRLQLTSPGVNIFKPTDLEKSVVIPGSSSFFIVQVVDDQNALGDATMPNRVLLNTDIPPGRWFLYDFGTVNKRKWKIVVDICRYIIQQFDDLPRHAIKYLDIGSKLELKFRVTPVNVAYNVFHNRLIHIVIGRPSLLDVRTKTYYDDNNSNLIDVTVHSRFFEKGKSTIAVIALGSLRCEVTTLVLTLKNSCSYLKSMHYVLSAKTSPSDWLVEDVSAEPNGSAIARLLKQLPVNYRPPSVLGIAVPLTENFYNADPSKPKLRDYFTNSKNSGRYKQCAGKSKRSECGCTENMKLSFSVAFSDCKEKALRMKFPVSRLPLYFTIEDEGRYVNLTSPYFITIIEVNNRTNWKVSGTNQTSSMLKMKKYLEHRLKTELYNPDGLSITITGSELFHFRVSTIPGVSFCNLFDEFQIYIDDSPLAFPGNSLITSMTTILMGGIIFVAYILYVFEIEIWNFLKRKLRRNKVASKPPPKRDSVNSGDSAGS